MKGNLQTSPFSLRLISLLERKEVSQKDLAAAIIEWLLHVGLMPPEMDLASGFGESGVLPNSSVFTKATDRIAELMDVHRSYVYKFIGISKGMYFAYRSGSSPVSGKAWERVCNTLSGLDIRGRDALVVSKVTPSLPPRSCPFCGPGPAIQFIEWQSTWGDGGSYCGPAMRCLGCNMVVPVVAWKKRFAASHAPVVQIPRNQAVY